MYSIRYVHYYFLLDLPVGDLVYGGCGKVIGGCEWRRYGGAADGDKFS